MTIAMPSNPDSPETYVNDFRQYLTKDVSTGPFVTLTGPEAAKMFHVYTGTLTGDVDVIVPTEQNGFYVYNNTSGAFSLTVKTATGSGVVVTQGKKVKLGCDGADVEQWSAEL